MNADKCLKPLLILHPNIVQNFDSAVRIVAFGQTLYAPSDLKILRSEPTTPFRLFYLLKERFGSGSAYRTFFGDSERTTPLRDIANNVVFVTEHGETLPIFLAVPCGKCKLCIHEKIKEWSCRMLLESNSYCQIPMFVLLTFNDMHLPRYARTSEEAKEVYKAHFQKFMKRFREIISRRSKQTEGMRFIAVLEFSPKKNRPHYHLVLWNYPTDLSAWEIYCCLEYAWSCRVKESYYTKLPFTYQVPWKRSAYDDVRYKFRERIGFVYYKMANTGSISYVCKYMMKQQVEEKRGFMLYSRRPAIGAPAMDFVREQVNTNINPFMLNVPDYVSQMCGKTAPVLKFSLPTYFKNKLFPSFSSLITKKFGDVTASVCLRNFVSDCVSLMRSVDAEVCDDFMSVRHEVASLFGNVLNKFGLTDVHLVNAGRYTIVSDFSALCERINEAYCFLMAQPDYDWVEMREYKKQCITKCLNAMDDCEKPDLEALLYKCEEFVRNCEKAVKDDYFV